VSGKNNKEEETLFVKGNYVAVMNGKVDASGLVSTSVTVCTILHVGCDDVFVQSTSSQFSNPVRYIVSKQACVPLSIDPGNVVGCVPAQPSIGDMVLFHDKLTWSSKELELIVGTVYEISFMKGRPSTATVMRGTDMIELPYASLLVLQKAHSVV